MIELDFWIKVGDYSKKAHWVKGYAYDIHTLGSKCVGYRDDGSPIFDNTYSEMGKLVKEFKYYQDVSKLRYILQLLYHDEEFTSFISDIDVILPVAPSNKDRNFQPVNMLADAISNAWNIFFAEDMISTINTEQIKGAFIGEKYSKVKDSLIMNYDLSEKDANILIIDDVYDSGCTLQAYTDFLNSNGYNNIFVFTLTKTRKAD